MSYVSHVAGPTRCFDHIYDPLCKLSSQKDISKANTKSINKSAPIQVISIYSSMFCDMSSRPNYVYLKRQNHLPLSTNSNVNSKRSDVGKKVRNEVEGTLRFSYFYYPRDNVKLINLGVNISPEPCECIETPKVEYQTVGCQTVYRESSAQTKPYLPEYYLTNDNDGLPEIVTIAKTIRGDDNPGELETQMIERSRKRKQYLEGLPQPRTSKEWSQWRASLESFEWAEFLATQKIILDKQDIRLDFVRNLMTNREMIMRKNSDCILREEFRKIQREKKAKMEKLSQKFKREMRKIELTRQNIPRRYRAVNVVEEHINQASDLYAPRMRFGIDPKRQHFQPFHLCFDARLENLEKKYAEVMGYPCAVRQFDRICQPKGPLLEVEKGFTDDEHLTSLYKSLKELGDKLKGRKISARCKSSIGGKCLSANLKNDQTNNVENITTKAVADRFVEGIIKDAIFVASKKD